jgi:GLPGLI family protein
LDKSIFEQSSLLGDNVYCKTELKDNWVLHNETKMIDNFLCYKATNINKVVGIDRIFNHPVTAWYCPALPYRYGPNGYGNLPGLILELQVRNVNYASKSIQLQSELRFDTDFLKKAKILTTEELERKLMEFNNFEGK